MLIYQHITIDLKAARDHVNAPERFPAADRKRLLSLYDTFERGRFCACVQMMQKWGDAEGENYPLLECVDDDVFDVVHGAAFGNVYSVGSDPKVKSRKRRAKT
jgi:hypothetical protein